MVDKYVPRRGDAIWIDFDPQVGHEQSGHRPAIVLSPENYNKRVGLLLVCPVTTQRKGYTFEVVIPAGLKISGVILADQVKSLDWRERRATLIQALPEALIEEVLGKLEALLR
jgi:mRNA interferase MazF